MRTTLAFFAALLAFSSTLSAQVLITPSFNVTIIGCDEGVVACDDVRYVGVSRKTGNVLALKGRTRHTLGADGVTPSRFLGYEFRSGNTTYSVSDDGALEVRRGSTVLVSEQGKWVD